MKVNQWWRYTDGCWEFTEVHQINASVFRFLQDKNIVLPVVAVTPKNIRDIVALAENILGPHELSDFDSNLHWIPVANGVYDIQSNTLLPPSPKNLITHKRDFPYDPDAGCPRWERFMTEVMLTTRGETYAPWVSIMQEWFGYCLVPDTSAQQAMYWKGTGENGKGITTRLIDKLVGPESCTAVSIEDLHREYYRAELFGKLIGFVDEPDPKAMKQNGTHYKRLTGQDKINGRRPNEKVINFRPTVRLIVSCNQLPSTTDLSKGYFRRPIIIEWRYQNDEVPEEKKEQGIEAVLHGEISGIFNWALVGLRRFRATRTGNGFALPDESKMLLQEYKLNEDSLSRFIGEEAKLDDPESFVPVPQFYAAYREWCKAAGEPNILSRNSFTIQMTSQKFTKRQKWLFGKNTWVWNGIGLVDPQAELPTSKT